MIIWHLLGDPEARFADLGPDSHARKGDRDRKIRVHLRELWAFGLDATITPRPEPKTTAHQARCPHYAGPLNHVRGWQLILTGN